MFLNPNCLKPWRLIGIAVNCIFVVSGCTLVPGMYMGVVPANLSETDKEYVYDEASTQDVSERAEIIAITPRSISKLAEAEHVVFQSSRYKPRIDQRAESTHRYVVGTQDVLLVTVWNHPELNNPSGNINQFSGRVVGEDGTFFFPYAGKVRAAGKSVQEIREDLTARLSNFLVDPQVDVSVLQFRSQRAFVMGQVEKPGVVPITDVPVTVTDLISQAGGLTPDADLRAATLMRDGKSLPIDLYALYYRGDIEQNIPIRSGDILTIPENRYNKVFVLGEVTKPQSIIMPRGRLSLAEAISDSGGFNPFTANAGQLYVIRGNEDGRPQIWHLDAGSPDALVLADRFTLQPRDIVYVDPASVARFSRVINNILPTATVLRATLQN